ncbi:MAG: hypothetical protein JRH11_23880 [Deltaproteobacteria bacterium]|nr:hypothetical protein [Deltaproteobacteria bacterium]
MDVSRRSLRSVVTALAVFVVIAPLNGCSTDGPPGTGGDGAVRGTEDGATPDPTRPTDGAVEPGDASLPDGGPGGACTFGARACDSATTERICDDVGGAPAWASSPCPVGQACEVDRCVPTCADECVLGSTEGGRSCRLYSESAGAFVEAGPGMHTLARQHLAFTRTNHLSNGYVTNTLFRTPALRDIDRYTGTVDAAEWTGSYLAAESLRLMSTRSPDAETNVAELIERLAELFEVTGTPGYMARIWGPLGRDRLNDQVANEVFNDTTATRTTFHGAPAYYHGYTSRDMYSGVMLGLGLGYDATSSEVHRERVREVVVTLARELIKERRAVPVRVRFNAFGSWQTLDQNWDMTNTVLIPNEMEDGRVLIQIGTTEDPSDYEQSILSGAREFLPDMRTVLHQAPLIGSVIPAIPRSGSAVMLASFLGLAIHATEGIAGWEADHDAIEAYYLAHRDGWVPIMANRSYVETVDCNDSYFGKAIVFHSAYSLLRLEPEGPFRAAVQRDLLEGELYPEVRGHLNVYFDYIGAAQGPSGLVSAVELETATSELGDFTAPPKLARAVDNRARYAGNSECENQSMTPVAIRDRVPLDFIWQHHPYRLVNPYAHDRHVYPPVDYLLAYWMGRSYGFIDEDAANTCTRWE